MTIYLNIWDLMKKKWISGLELSKLSWISPEHISKMKRWWTKRIELDTIEKLLVSLDAKPNDLLKFKQKDNEKSSDIL